MRQLNLTLNLDDDANPFAIKQSIKNMKGVSQVIAQRNNAFFSSDDIEDEEWDKMIDSLRNSEKLEDMNLNDERTRYILENR